MHGILELKKKVVFRSRYDFDAALSYCGCGLETSCKWKKLF